MRGAASNRESTARESGEAHIQKANTSADVVLVLTDSGERRLLQSVANSAARLLLSCWGR
jgi:hypothetical protein